MKIAVFMGGSSEEREVHRLGQDGRPHFLRWQEECPSRSQVPCHDGSPLLRGVHEDRERTE